MYRQLHGMNKIECFHGIEDSFMLNVEEYKHIFDSTKANTEALP